MTPIDPELRQALIDGYDEISDRNSDGVVFVNRDGWWQDPLIIQRLPVALVAPFRDQAPTVVLGPQSSGYLLGPLAARELGVGFVAARKEVALAADSDDWIRTTTAPDYRDRHLELGFRRGAVGGGDRVLVVDDWADTGSQLLALHRLVEQAEARVVGTVVIADGLTDSRVRRDLRLTSLVHARELWH
ncbi:phosphoribosyltransferase family protein [Amnibacterium endophyticum]|uniref:Phosphoribosyltransferase family protein n=1 Tax=Amnibacterium endophyticum TaxID=2109337 RepID=A0ABW4LB39_9MICO